MKKFLYFMLFIVTLCGCSLKDKSNSIKGQINVLPAFEQLSELKLSQLGKKVRYIPLETTDESLIANDYNISLLEDKILVNTNGKYILFDKQTGKFLRTIGQRGQGQYDYTNPGSPIFIQKENGNLHLIQNPNKLLVYNQEGEYLATQRLPIDIGNNHYVHLMEEGGIMYESIAIGNDNDNHRLVFFNKQGEKTDSILFHTPKSAKALDMNAIQRISIYSRVKASQSTFGMLAYNGLIVMDLKTEVRKLIPAYYPALWQCENKTLFHNAFNDTVFQIKEKTLVPHLIFNMGEKHFPIEKQGIKEGTEDLLTVTYIMETPQIIYFQLTEGIHCLDTEKIYDGIYNKQSGEVSINKRAPLKDDLNGFMPFYLHTHNQKGEFGSLLEVPDILEWLEEHPETSLEGNLAPLKGLVEDDNPVCVIVEP